MGWRSSQYSPAGRIKGVPTSNALGAESAPQEAQADAVTVIRDCIPFFHEGFLSLARRLRLLLGASAQGRICSCYTDDDHKTYHVLGTRLSSVFFFSFFISTAPGLHCCPRAFSGCGARAIVCCNEWPSRCRGFSCHRTQDSRQAGFSSCGAWALLFCHKWNLPGPGIEPVSLHWQADSYPLRHQGSPMLSILYSWRCFLIRGQNDPWTHRPLALGQGILCYGKSFGESGHRVS